MNAMGHDVPTMIGLDHREVVKEITKLVPDYMVMGERGMADMAEMEMPLPDNTVPMMGGAGPFGSVEMGGMFTVVKVRADQKPGDYSSPEWFKHPQGTVAYEFTGQLSAAPMAQVRGSGSMPVRVAPNNKDVEVQIRKPGAAAGHSSH
jgi:hypothetical protein